MPAAPDVIDSVALVDFTVRLLAARSPSGEEGAVASLVTAEMERLGFAVEVDRLGNVTGRVGTGTGPTVLIDSHMDTVGVTDPAAWARNPDGERVGDRIYGRGAMDMKGPLAASLYGIAALAPSLQNGTVVVSASIAEEMIEGPALEAIARRVRPDYVVIGEATNLKVARGQRGRAEIRVETFGRPTHSSRPELGVNAADALVDVISALRRFRPPTHQILGAGILVLTDVMTRPYPALSVVPDYAVATYDRRTLPGESAESVLGEIQEAMADALRGSPATGQAGIAEDDLTTYTGARVVAPNFAPAWFYGEDAQIVRLSRQGLQAVGLPGELTHYAFCTNGSGTAGRLGIPTIGFGPGDEALAHRVDEYITVEDLMAGARGYASIARHLTGNAATT